MRRIGLALIALALVMLFSSSAWAGPRWRRGYYRYYNGPAARTWVGPRTYYRGYYAPRPYPYRSYYYGNPGFYGYPRGGVSVGFGFY